VFQSIENPNDVNVWHDFETAEAAEAFASSEKLKNAMQRASVEGEPEIWFVTAS
jgi:hypothetical protein